MEIFLKKIGVIRNFSKEFPFDRKFLVFLLNKNIDQADYSLVSKLTERFKSSPNKYIGTVDSRGFNIRKRKRFIDFDKNSTKISGTYREKNNSFYVNFELKAFSTLTMSIYIISVGFIIFYAGFNLFIKDNLSILSILSILSFEVSLLYGIPWWVARSRIKRAELEFQIDIYNWVLN